MDLYFLDWVRTRYKTGYYDQADASYELRPHGQLGWGSGLALAIWVGLGRVGQEVKKNNLRSKDDVWTVVLSESPWTANRRSLNPALIYLVKNFIFFANRNSSKNMQP